MCARGWDCRRSPSATLNCHFNNLFLFSFFTFKSLVQSECLSVNGNEGPKPIWFSPQGGQRRPPASCLPPLHWPPHAGAGAVLSCKWAGWGRWRVPPAPQARGPACAFVWAHRPLGHCPPHRVAAPPPWLHHVFFHESVARVRTRKRPGAVPGGHGMGRSHAPWFRGPGPLRSRGLAGTMIKSFAACGAGVWECGCVCVCGCGCVHLCMGGGRAASSLTLSRVCSVPSILPFPVPPRAPPCAEGPSPFL